MRSKLFGSTAVRTVSMVEPQASRLYAHKARVTFYVIGVVTWAATSAVLSLTMPLAAAIVFGALAGVACGLAASVTVRAWPVLRALGWWAAEIALLIAADLLFSVLSRLMPSLVVVLLFAVSAVVVAAVPRLRRAVRAWVWCGIVRHRLRMCFAQFVRTATRATLVPLPLILLARPTPAGERVWVWLRPGLDLSDLDGKAPKLAVACWASEVRVVRASTRYAALIRVDIGRRDPLRAVIASPLPAQLPGWEMPAPVSPGMAPLALDLDDVPELALPEVRSSRR